jgi:hypothetical protein
VSDCGYLNLLATCKTAIERTATVREREFLTRSLARRAAPSREH